MTEEFDCKDTFIQQLLILVVVLAVIFLIQRRSFSKKRLDAVRNRPSHTTLQDHVIVAWELDNLLVEVSDRKKPGFHRVELETKGFKFALERVKQMFGMGIFYRAKTSLKSMKIMLQTLTENPKVKLFLYTTLELPAAEFIMEKLCISSFFSLENRRSCSDCYSQRFKHPTEVDYNTKRVIILTGSNMDHQEEHSKYFLVLKKKELTKSVKYLTKIIGRNESVDELHNQLGELKAYVESDCQ